MKNRYSDISTRPHSALVGSPFRNVVRRFDADLVRQHHQQTVSNARSAVDDQPEPVFANILDRRGYDPAAYRASQEASMAAAASLSSAAAGSPIRAAGQLRQSSGGMDFGGGGIPGSSDARSVSPPGRSSSRKKTRKSRSSKSPRSRSSGSPSPPPTSGGGMSTNLLSAHRNKVHAMTHKRDRGNSYAQQPRGDRSPSPTDRTPARGGGGGGGGGGASSPSSGGRHGNNVARSDSGLFRAAPAGLAVAPWGQSSSSAGSPVGGSSPLATQFSPASRYNHNNNNNNNNNGRLSPSSGGRSGGGVGGSGGHHGERRPVFGIAQQYQRWSNTQPGFGPGGDHFAAAMRGAQSSMDDAESVEVRREIQGAIEGFLYRPVARRFADETAKWVEEHILPFAMVGGAVAAVGGGADRPNSAGSRSQNSGGTDSSRSGPEGANAANRGGGADNTAARRQRTLELTEALLPLVFHHIANEVRDVVRLRIEAALLKRETRTSYL